MLTGVGTVTVSRLGDSVEAEALTLLLRHPGLAEPYGIALGTDVRMIFVRADLLEYTVDRSPYKQGRFLPGTHIPIHPPGRIEADRPDFVLILPWNLRTEISAQLRHVAGWGISPMRVIRVRPAQRDHRGAEHVQPFLSTDDAFARDRRVLVVVRDGVQAVRVWLHAMRSIPLARAGALAFVVAQRPPTADAG